MSPFNNANQVCGVPIVVPVGEGSPLSPISDTTNVNYQYQMANSGNVPGAPSNVCEVGLSIQNQLARQVEAFANWYQNLPPSISDRASVATIQLPAQSNQPDIPQSQQYFSNQFQQPMQLFPGQEHVRWQLQCDQQQVQPLTTIGIRRNSGQQSGAGLTSPSQIALPNGATKRIRITYTSTQLATLEHAFSESKYLPKSKKIVFAQALGLSEKQIKVWFQNRRTKCKKEEKARSSLSSASSASSLSPESAPSVSALAPRIPWNSNETIVDRLLSHSAVSQITSQDYNNLPATGMVAQPQLYDQPYQHNMQFPSAAFGYNNIDWNQGIHGQSVHQVATGTDSYNSGISGNGWIEPVEFDGLDFPSFTDP